MDTLPRGLSPGLLDFCRSISSERPRFVASRPRQDARPSECFINVARRIEGRGGTMECGWAIWHLPGAYFEAEHHGIWRKSNGELVDVSPQLNGYKKVLFLPDPDAPYEFGTFRPNIIRAASTDHRALDLVDLSLRRNQILNAYRPKDLGSARAVPISHADHAECERLADRMRELLGELTGRRNPA